MHNIKIRYIEVMNAEPQGLNSICLDRFSSWGGWGNIYLVGHNERLILHEYETI